MSGLGPELDLGEPQWAVEFGDRRAHWFAIDLANPNRVKSPCGILIRQPLLYQPGNYELCRHCASRHRPPNRRFISPRVMDWMNRPIAPIGTDKLRQ